MLVEGSRIKEFELKTPAEQLQDYFVGLKTKVDAGFAEPTETTIHTADGREIFIAVLDPQKVFAEQNAMMIEAHPDDAALAGGIANVSADIGMGVSFVTLTDGGARELDGFPDRTALAKTRLPESVDAAKVAGGALVVNLGYPDADLTKYKKSAANEVAAIINVLNPTFAVATYPSDAHGDHSSGYRIAKLARRKTGTSLYAADTQDGTTKWGFRTRLSHYLPITPDVKAVRDASFAEHKSQQPGSIPVQDEIHVQQVIDMPARHGEKIGTQFAIGLRKTLFSKDTLTEQMSANNRDVVRPRNPRVLYERAKTRVRSVLKVA